MADEVYMLYPEDPGNLARVKDRPDHQYFKKFGEAMPPGAWHHPGTKQGIYMIGPNAEYLEGRFAASGDVADIRARMGRALARWEILRKEQGYANAPVPPGKELLPNGISGKLIFRVNVRDLPRLEGDRSGARFQDIPQTGQWMDFTKWAWNENWTGLDGPEAFVPSGAGTEEVPSSVWNRICREVLVDNVRGQAPGWQPGDVKSARLTKRFSGSEVVYEGSVNLQDAQRSYTAKVYGTGKWNASTKAFEALDLVVIGTRSGASRFNQRENDKGPAPMGISLSLFLKE